MLVHLPALQTSRRTFVTAPDVYAMWGFTPVVSGLCARVRVGVWRTRFLAPLDYSLPSFFFKMFLHVYFLVITYCVGRSIVTFFFFNEMCFCGSPSCHPPIPVLPKDPTPLSCPICPFCLPAVLPHHPLSISPASIPSTDG